MSIVQTTGRSRRAARHWAMTHDGKRELAPFDKLSKKKRHAFGVACRGIGRYLRKTKGAK